MQGIYPQADGSVLVDGAVLVRELNRRMAWNLPGKATTIAGLLIHDAAAIPEAGQTFAFHGFRFDVVGKSRNRITAIKVTPTTQGLCAGRRANQNFAIAICASTKS